MELLIAFLLFAGFVAFVAAAFSPPWRVNLIAVGLACWILTELLPHLGLH